MKVKVQHQFVVSLTAVGDTQFSPEFLLKVKELIPKVAAYWSIPTYNMDLGVKCIVVELHGIDMAKASAVKNDVVQKIVLLAEHGPDGDLLDTLLARHPELKSHPKFSGLLGAFENLNGVIKDILSDKSNQTVAEIQRRQAEGIELQPEDLTSSGPHKRAMSVEERQQFRTAAIRGQTDEQKLPKPVQEEPQIPEIYKNLAEKTEAVGATPKEFGPPLPGDEGNVFTRSAKK